VTAAYTPGVPVPGPDPEHMAAQEVFARVVEHGDAHAVKFADTALDVGDTTALSAALCGVRLIEPLDG
jgi:hypothetical protein